MHPVEQAISAAAKRHAYSQPSYAAHWMCDRALASHCNRNFPCTWHQQITNKRSNAAAFTTGATSSLCILARGD